MPKPFVFTRIYLSRPVDADALEHLTHRLMASDVPRPLALEVRGQDDGIQYVLGCAPTAVHELKHLFVSFIPGISFGPADRTPVIAAGNVVAPRNGLPLAQPTPETLAGSIYAALDRRKTGESIVVQVILGRAHAPTYVSSGVADPHQSMPHRLWRGTRAAGSDVRRKLADHTSSSRLDVTLRLGVAGPDAERRRALVYSLFGAVQQLQAPGVTLHLSRETAVRVNLAQVGRAGLSLTAHDLAAVVGWPVGTRDYPGVDPLHPKRLPVPTGVTSKESLFAVGTAPGPERLVGLTAEARLSHLSVMAPTGSGKSEAVLAPLLLSDVAAGRPVVLVDPKGQLVEFLTDCLGPEVAERLEIFNPADFEGTARFNPLDARGRDAYAVVDGCMAVFKAVFKEGWGPRTEDILHSACLSLAIDGQRRNKPHTLLDIPTLLTDDAFRRSAVGSIADEVEIARFWARYDGMSPAQREHEISAPMNKLRRYLMRKGVTAVLGDPDPAFRLRDIWKTDKIVLVALNDGLSGVQTSQLVGGFICAEVFMAAQERAAEKDPKKTPGFVYVDEVRKFLHLPLPIGEALEICRSYGVGWALFGQGYYQLSGDLADAVSENTKSKITFAAGQKEARLIAKQTTQFTADDVLQLPKYEIYASLLTGGGSSGWFSARTLPPPSRLGHGAALLHASRQRHQPPPKLSPSSSPMPEPSQSQASDEAATKTSAPHVKRRRT
ncbi:type IV secretory system conjugative DNA transfer family protein [Microbacterium sp. ASV49]|uniref:Type IV secretory system conjugative DNA transfer family protein n=1 Tax=Microbacterium candidum TaxID=3041922 RepID=A0ABT7N0B0_9MICO|nr:type IV secretory system conjugative DNA transfer family protein [Microbacterium sp. ASV49]MDL9980100.1 type IV secretory system conjugative DNA transfer family protein [Microbacterium sp. ASV49]